MVTQVSSGDELLRRNHQVENLLSAELEANTVSSIDARLLAAAYSDEVKLFVLH